MASAVENFKNKYGLNTTSTQTGATSVTPVSATTTPTESTTNTAQTGSTGNASTNPYSNAYQTYKTNMQNVQLAKLGQLDTEYNNQQKQIEGAYQNLGRNAYVTYMQRNLANRNNAAALGANRTGLAENMQTANAVDYNRSVGNVGAYRTSQLSNAENTYNTNVANANSEYDADLASKSLEYDKLGIDRANELADLQSQQDFTAAENAKDRKQSAYEANQSLKATRMQNRFQVFENTISGYTTTKQVDSAIKKLKAAKKNGTLSGWKKEYYSDILMTLRAQRNQIKNNK